MLGTSCSRRWNRRPLRPSVRNLSRISGRPERLLHLDVALLGEAEDNNSSEMSRNTTGMSSRRDDSFASSCQSAPAYDHPQEISVDLLRLLELRGLLIDDDLGRVLHEPGPAQALRHLHDGELAFVGQLDDVGGHVLNKPSRLDKESRRAGQHDAPAELPLALDVALEREHGGKHQLPTRKPVGDVGHLAHGDRADAAPKSVLSREDAGVPEHVELEYLFDRHGHGPRIPLVGH